MFKETNPDFTRKPRILVIEKLKQFELFLKQAELKLTIDTNTSIPLNLLLPPKTPMCLHKLYISSFALNVFINGGSGSNAGT